MIEANESGGLSLRPKEDDPYFSTTLTFCKQCFEQTVGELSFLSSSPHSATATAQTTVETALLTHQALGDLVRRRPDIGVILYRNLAAGIGRSDLCVRDRVLNQ